MDKENVADQINGIALAYMGDAIYEVYVRRHLLRKGISKPTKLQHLATHYVSAKAQAELIQKMTKEQLLEPIELEIFKRGRNAKSHTSAKNTDVITYRISTGFEAVFGYLFLQNEQSRLEKLANWCLQQVDEELK
ncbi:Mini-ribonuclease 3 [Liquorilactobacillus sicerae]|uniref:Mini-ribonuclease 3 n=1 Tax=Liquorilactobacillus sicerae TaxID=1416943 RepID=UPI002480917E|nr:Mini-ribonuclease 3 [Liquorilactobacillus sicerae]